MIQRLRFWLAHKWLLTRMTWCHIETLPKLQERCIALYFKEEAHRRAQKR